MQRYGTFPIQGMSCEETTEAASGTPDVDEKNAFVASASPCCRLHYVNGVACHPIAASLSSPRESRIKKIPYQAPPTQLGPRKCTFWKNALFGPKYQC